MSVLAANRCPDRCARRRLLKSFFLAAAVLSAVSLPAAEPAGADEEPPPTAADIPVRVEQAQVGEWCLYNLASGGQMRLTVVEKVKLGKETILTIMNEQIPPKRDRKKPIRRSYENVTVSEAAAQRRYLDAEDILTRGEVLVKDMVIPVIIVNTVERGRITQQTYLSGRIPVHGLVRGFSSPSPNEREVTLGLVDFGYGGGEE